MVGKGNQIIISTVTLVLVALMAIYLIKPFSLIHFIGPMTGVASAFTIAWGFRILVSIGLAMSLFSVVLLFLTGQALDFSIFIVATLAILLQSFWAKQLVEKGVQQQQWLENRNILLVFILKIGPLASLVSGCAVIVIAILNEKDFGSSTFYLFFSSWATSVLTVVFFTPILLFAQGIQQLSSTRRVFVVFASTLASLSVVLLFIMSQHAAQYQRLEQFEHNKASIVLAISQEIAQVKEPLKAIATFFQSSELVTYEEFQTFSTGIFNLNSSVKSLAWAPYVDYSHKDKFQQVAADYLGKPIVIHEQLASGHTVSVNKRSDYYPTLYRYPLSSHESTLGLDLQHNKAKFKAMNLAHKYKKTIATAPIMLALNDYSSPSILVFVAVNNPRLQLFSTVNNSSNAQATGFVFAEVQFDSFFQRLAKLTAAKSLTFSILENTSKVPFLLFGDNFSQSNANKLKVNNEKHQLFFDTGKLTEIITLEVFSRQWKITVSEKTAWSQQAVPWQTWLMLVGGSMGAFIFQLLILMMAAYSTELSHQVVLKTRELILAKEGSEQKNSAKSDFLTTLSTELKTPVNAIEYFVAKFRQHPTFQQAERSIEDIANAGQSLTKIIENVIDFTNIEADSSSLQLSVFDFKAMLHRSDVLLNVTYAQSSIHFKLMVSENVPVIIESDELRLSKLIVVLAEIANNIFASQQFSFSIKAHLHQLKRVTLFLVVAPVGLNSLMNTKQISAPSGASDLDFHSISMTMVKGICQLFDGDVKLNQLPSGERVLTASVKVNLPPDGSDGVENTK